MYLNRKINMKCILFNIIVNVVLKLNIGYLLHNCNLQLVERL